MIPPEADAEFAASMEEVLDVYARPYDSRYPVLCMDEQPIQLLKETRTPIAGTKKHPRRVDYEYERAGTASIFMFCEPLAGWRQVSVRERRTKVDWAQEMERLLQTRYQSAKKVILVCDNLNTYTRGAFYEAFQPTTARSLFGVFGFSSISMTLPSLPTVATPNRSGSGTSLRKTIAPPLKLLTYSAISSSM